MNMWNEKSGHPSPAGFTLIEIMIALAVISISFVVLLGLRNRDIALATYTHHMTEATLLARQKITETTVTSFPNVGELEGDFGEDYPGYTWKQEVKPTPYDVVRELVVTVFWEEGKAREEVRFTTYLFNVR